MKAKNPQPVGSNLDYSMGRFSGAAPIWPACTRIREETAPVSPKSPQALSRQIPDDTTQRKASTGYDSRAPEYADKNPHH